MSGENGLGKADTLREREKIGLDLTPPVLIANAMRATDAQVRH